MTARQPVGVPDAAMVPRPGAAFGNAKRDTLPSYRVSCDVRFACHGECPKNRFITTPEGEPGLNYLCAGYFAFFHHVDGRLKIMANLLRNAATPAR
jgi:uncharacterized protein